MSPSKDSLSQFDIDSGLRDEITRLSSEDVDDREIARRLGVPARVVARVIAQWERDLWDQARLQEQAAEPDLTRQEADEVARVLTPLSRQVKYRVHLGNLLWQWEEFVKEIEDGYGDNFHEYEFELGMRDVLETVLNEASDPLRRKIMARSSPIDARFRVATRPLKRPLRPLTYRGDWPSWWWFRVPIHPRGELAEGIKWLDSQPDE